MLYDSNNLERYLSLVEERVNNDAKLTKNIIRLISSLNRLNTWAIMTSENYANDRERIIKMGDIVGTKIITMLISGELTIEKVSIYKLTNILSDNKLLIIDILLTYKAHENKVSVLSFRDLTEIYIRTGGDLNVIEEIVTNHLREVYNLIISEYIQV